MKDKKAKIKNLVGYVVSISLVSMVLWPLLDWLAQGSKFGYSVSSYIIQPIIFGITIGLIIWLYELYKTRKK